MPLTVDEEERELVAYRIVFTSEQFLAHRLYVCTWLVYMHLDAVAVILS